MTIDKHNEKILYRLAFLNIDINQLFIVPLANQSNHNGSYKKISYIINNETGKISYCGDNPTVTKETRTWILNVRLPIGR